MVTDKNNRLKFNRPITVALRKDRTRDRTSLPLGDTDRPVKNWPVKDWAVIFDQLKVKVTTRQNTEYK